MVGPTRGTTFANVWTNFDRTNYKFQTVDQNDWPTRYRRKEKNSGTGTNYWLETKTFDQNGNSVQKKMAHSTV
jgi:hypothetical protein